MKRAKTGSQIALRNTQLSAEAQINSGPRQDFTYKRIVGAKITKGNFHQSLFIGAVFEDCHFISVGFNRCDFSGVKIVKCTFEGCQFVPDEFRSCLIGNSHFSDCNFRGCEWMQIQVEESTFSRCDFRGATIRESQFEGCEFSHWSLRRCSITGNDFTKCRFRSVDLGDCTALFLFFNSCDFDQSRINVESIGFTYGLTVANIERLNLIHLGKSQAKPALVDLVEILIDAYRERGWHIGASIIELNFRRRPPLASMRDLAEKFASTFADMPIDWEEFKFFVQIMERLQSEQRLPLLGLWLVIGILKSVAQQQTFINSAVSENVRARADRLLMQILDEVVPAIEIKDVAHKNILLDLVLQGKPNEPIAELVSANIYRIFSATKPILVEAGPGSWHEIWECGIAALAAIHLSLVAVNGVLVQLNKAAEQAQRIGRLIRGKKKGTRSSAKVTRKQPAKAPSPGQFPALIAAQIYTVQRRAEKLTAANIALIDRTLGALSVISEGEIEKFDSYSVGKLRSAKVRRTRSRQA
jgi:uncharacterized protein YjbI with pentapeptide repeats